MVKMLYRDNYTTGKLIAECMGIEAITKDSAPQTESHKIIRWGSTASVNRQDGVKATTLINNAKAIKEVYDKSHFRAALTAEGLCPETWDCITHYLLNKGAGDVRTIVRPKHHHAGSDFFDCPTSREVAEAVVKINGPFYISRFVEKKAEYRVFVVSGRVAAVVRKVPSDMDNPYWGCTEGPDKFKYVRWSDWNTNLLDVAVRSFLCSSLDFGAFDIVEDQNGEFFTLEANTAPEMTPYYAKTLAKCFNYIVENGNDRIEVTDTQSWKGYIHPAIHSQ